MRIPHLILDFENASVVQFKYDVSFMICIIRASVLLNVPSVAKKEIPCLFNLRPFESTAI